MTQPVTHYEKPHYSGRMTKAEILHDVPPEIYRRARRTAHNEYERPGTVEGWLATTVRYQSTDIVTVWRETFNGEPVYYLKLDFGGWHTISTRRHIMDAARRHGWGVVIRAWGEMHSEVRVYSVPGGRMPAPLIFPAGDGPDCVVWDGKHLHHR